MVPPFILFSNEKDYIMKLFFTFLGAMLLTSISSFAQNNETLKGDVNEDGIVDVADIATIISIMASGEVTLKHYFYLGTNKPTAENYKILPGVVTSFTSIDDAIGTTASIAAGETLYMMCPLKWMYGKNVSLEDEMGVVMCFSESVDSVTISDYAIYSTRIINDEKNVVLKTSSEQRNWHELMRFPSREEIELHNDTSTRRAPYVQAWLDTQIVGKFSEFVIDFKADYLPLGTYCSLAAFKIDYSSLYELYSKVSTNNICGYAGFQRNHLETDNYNSILSLWNVYLEYETGEKDTLSAKLIKPISAYENNFSHEGSGVNYLPFYPWKPKKWYRMLLKCGKATVSGNTTIEQWVCDLLDNKWTQLCVFDLGVSNLTFKGNTCVFLENFEPKTSGEIRTLEFKNARIYDCETKQWFDVESALFSEGFRESNRYTGSYQFGSDGSTFWMISTGVPNCANPQDQNIKYEIRNTESGVPY